jgi:hypothetical protein
MEYRITPVTLPSEKRSVYELRSEAFLEGSPDTAARLQDEYDGQPNCRTFLLVTEAGHPVGTVRVCVFASEFDWLPIPAFDFYEDELIAARKGLVFVQSTLFALARKHRAVVLTPKLLLMREVVRSAVTFRADEIITIVRNQGSQLRFYGRMGFIPIGPAKTHPLWNRETTLIGVSPRDLLRSVRRNPALELVGDLETPL